MTSAPPRDPTESRDPRASEAGGVLSIDLAALVANWRALSGRVAPAACAAVVKADGYGCGIEPVTAALMKAGCQTFFVADLSEARRVRAVAPSAIVYVLNGVPPGTLPAYADADARPVIGSLLECDEWLSFCTAYHWPGKAALHVDTGINRLGLSPQEAVRVAKRPEMARLFGLVMSHFACADDPSHALNATQMAAFVRVRQLFPDIPGSLANSSGIFLGPDAHHDLVRAGGALYGANPTPAHLNQMRAVVRLEARIIQVRHVAAGEPVGYGASWTAKRSTRIAVVAIGYADGIFRAAGGSDTKAGADAIVAGRRCALVGRISMDLLAIDVTDLPGDTPKRGDFAALLDDDIGVDELASHAGTIGYEVLTSLGRRYRRVYRNG
jgi:alanine racemase